ncbi:thioesterase family protein [Candidatus Wolfebacteria bacterium]|nr:thioesterase family protein [Candidatus Wolfebacteria bacterium]
MRIKEIRKEFPEDYNEELKHLNFTGAQKTMWPEVEKLLKELGVDMLSLKEVGKAMFIRNVNVNYFAQLRDEDDVDVFVEITRIKKFKLFFSGKITKGEETVCSATFTMGCIDKETGKPAQMPEL